VAPKPRGAKLRAAFCNAFDGVKALTLGEAPEPRPARDRIALPVAHKTGKRIGRDTSTRLPMMPFSRLIVNALRCESLSLFQNSAVSLD